MAEPLNVGGVLRFGRHVDRRSSLKVFSPAVDSAGAELLAEAVLLLRASEFAGVTGDDCVSGGTGGAPLNAVCDNVVDGAAAGTPVFSASPIPGFQLADSSSGDAGVGPFYSIPPSALLDPGTESFTVFAWVTWQETSSGFSNICSKIDNTGGAMGSGGTGWQLVDSPFTGGASILISSGGLNEDIPVGINFVASGAVMSVDTHLFVARVDIDTGLMNVFLDGVKSSDADASQLGDVTADHELIFGRGDHPHITHGYGYWNRALSDAEITTTLPAALGV